MRVLCLVLVNLFFSFSVFSQEMKLLLGVVDESNLFLTMVNSTGVSVEVKAENLCRSPKGKLEFLLMDSNKNIYKEYGHTNYQCKEEDTHAIRSNWGVVRVFNYSLLMSSSFRVENGDELISPHDGKYKLVAKSCETIDHAKVAGSCLTSNDLNVSIKNGKWVVE